MSHSRFLSLTLGLFLLPLLWGNAQSPLYPRIGLSFGPHLTSHSGAFSVIKNSAVCGEFEEGSGFGFRVEGYAGLPLSDRLLFSLRLGYHGMNGTLDRSARLGQGILSDGTLAPVTADQSYEARLGYLIATPGVQWYMLESLPIHLDVGAGLGFAISKSFTQTERITGPAGARFMDRSIEHTVLDGDIQDASSLRIDAQAGLGYDLAVTDHLVLTPEISVRFPLTTVQTRDDWRATTLGAGLTLAWLLTPPPPPPPPPPVAPPPPPPPPPVIAGLTVGLTLEGRTSNDEDTDGSELVVEELRTVERYPLLNYVFFAENEDGTALRQNLLSSDQTAGFQVESITGDELALYRDMLNIIGRRLTDQPRAKITLTGCNADQGPEKNNLDLSRRRAETVRDYFVSVWKIRPDRIVVRSRNLPADPSAQDTPEGQAENRRVEITSDTDAIIAPIRREELDYRTSLSALNLRSAIDAPNGIASWELTLRRGPELLYTAPQGTQPPEVASYSIDGERFQRNSQSLTAHLRVTDRKDQTREVTRNVTVRSLTVEKKKEEQLGDLRVNRSKLILFDFDKATLSPRNRGIIREVMSSIEPESRVTILGFTDITGNPEHNLKLSQQRADAVKEAMGGSVQARGITALGKGDTQLLFPNETPEGRFYCRMVQIIIETPVVNR